VSLWIADLDRARRSLARHNPIAAVHYFERALRLSRRTDETERMERSELVTIYEGLALSLTKVGMRNKALGFQVDAARLVKRGPVRRRLLTMLNRYGMARQPATQLDDREAFCGIQLARYVRTKRSQKLGTRAEIDVIVELLDEAWRDVASERDLGQLPTEEKEALFRSTTIVFPFLSVPQSLNDDELAIDFYNGRRVDRGDWCMCGSGLPYRVCHGRIPGIDEILIGDF
jgi:hypothetical protein